MDLKTVKSIMTMLSMCLVVNGCTENFRYPCQDPKNWDSEDCKPPICTATGTCPDDVRLPEKVKP